jgi:hypothetical protein
LRKRSPVCEGTENPLKTSFQHITLFCKNICPVWNLAKWSWDYLIQIWNITLFTFFQNAHHELFYIIHVNTYIWHKLMTKSITNHSLKPSNAGELIQHNLDPFQTMYSPMSIFICLSHANLHTLKQKACSQLQICFFIFSGIPTKANNNFIALYTY